MKDSNKTFDPHFEAITIISLFTENSMLGILFNPENNRELYDDMVKECSVMLTQMFIVDKKYTPLEYNAILNELAKILWDVFEKYIEDEDEDENSG